MIHSPLPTLGSTVVLYKRTLTVTEVDDKRAVATDGDRTYVRFASYRHWVRVPTTSKQKA